MSNELDLTVLKNILTNKKHGLDFANECDPKIFSTEMWNFANLIVGYIRTYKDLPTLRVVLEKLEKGNNAKLLEHVKTVWSQLDQTQANEREFKHDLAKLKKRYAEKQLQEQKERLMKLDWANVDIDKTLSGLQSTVQNIKSLNQVRSYERKTLKEAVPIFREEYNAKMENPKFDQGIKSGYSYFDFVTDGARPGELILIGGESGGGKSMLLMNMALQ